MNYKHLQAFIPGWNIYYMIREHRRWERLRQESDLELEVFRTLSREDVERGNELYRMSEHAKRQNDPEAAARYRRMSGEWYDKFIDRMKSG